MGRREDLEAAIDAAPDDAQRYQVYSDFLVELGDPLGELSQLRRVAETRADDRRLAEHLSALATRVVPEDLQRAGLTFRHGFLHTVALHDRGLGLERAALMFAMPWCRFVRRVVVTISKAVAPEWVGRLRSLLASWPRVTSVVIAVEAARPPDRLLSALPAHLRSLELRVEADLASVVQGLGDPVPLNLDTLTITRPGPWDARVLNGRRASAGSRCQLRLPRATFRADATLTAWTERVRTRCLGPALLVLSPADAAGILLPLEGSRAAWQIGAGPQCDLAIAEAGLKQVHAIVTRRDAACAIRPAERDRHSVRVNGTGVPLQGQALIDGDRIEAGKLELRYARDPDDAWDAAYARWRHPGPGGGGVFGA